VKVVTESILRTDKIEFAADLETPVSAFIKLAPLEPVFLLESVERNDTRGRYSFIGILPKAYFVLEHLNDAANYFHTLENCIASLPQIQNGRLSAGLIGFLSYPLSSFLHPKVQARQSEDPLAGFVLPSAILSFDHLKNKIQLNTVLTSEEELSLAGEIRSCLGSALILPAYGKSSEPQSQMSRSDFCRMIEKAHEYIASGDVYQVVLSMQFDGESEAHPFQMYRALRMINPSPYMFYLNFQDRFQFFGSSPETMVRTEGNRALLRPIAGTRPRGTDESDDRRLEADLLQDEKEKAEHLMLVDLARNDLGRIAAPGSVKVTGFMKVEKYSHVMHLVSTVESTLKGRPGLRDLLSAVFPAGTVSGAPKIRAMQIIDELEPHSRGLYAGSVGYFGSNGTLDHCIAIRCLQYRNGSYRFTAGAGIVADSVPEREYDEIHNKAMALRSMLRMAGESL